MNIKITNSDYFVKDLVSKIHETGFYGMSKTDFYDYVLFLMDKYSKNRFLKNNSNFENARLLKLSEQRVKNLKLNINLKFGNEEPEVVIADFFMNLTEENFKRVDGKYEFVLEDSYTRMCIENVLKRSGNTLDYKINTEKVQIDGENLQKFLSAYAADVFKKLKTKEMQNKIIEIGKNVLNTTSSVTGIAESLVDIGSIILNKK